MALGKINIGSRRKGKEEVIFVPSGKSHLLTKYMEKDDIHVLFFPQFSLARSTQKPYRPLSPVAACWSKKFPSKEKDEVWKDFSTGYNLCSPSWATSKNPERAGQCS